MLSTTHVLNFGICRRDARSENFRVQWFLQSLAKHLTKNCRAISRTRNGSANIFERHTRPSTSGERLYLAYETPPLDLAMYRLDRAFARRRSDSSPQKEEERACESRSRSSEWTGCGHISCGKDRRHWRLPQRHRHRDAGIHRLCLLRR
jgi:hypothetical protein